MLEKSIYMNAKRRLKCLCKTNLTTMCDEMELNDYERKILLSFYNGDKVVQTCLDLGISHTTYTKDLRQVFAKVIDYNKNIFN